MTRAKHTQGVAGVALGLGLPVLQTGRFKEIDWTPISAGGNELHSSQRNAGFFGGFVGLMLVFFWLGVGAALVIFWVSAMGVAHFSGFGDGFLRQLCNLAYDVA
jgi:hypothetical protein